MTTIQITFTAETSDQLDALIRTYLADTNLTAADARPLPRGLDADTASTTNGVTNEDYRRAIRAIPRGKVAPYSVVSEAVRGDQDGSQKVSGLAANDVSLGTAYRVVKKDGSIAAGFRWADGRPGVAHEGRKKLEEEGVRFDEHGRALPEYILTAAELRELVKK